MTIIAANGITYDVRFDWNENFEIERDDIVTGLRKVFVFQDLSIGDFISKRKEVIFYSYDITPTGERVSKERHSFSDFENEYEAFRMSEIWEIIKNSILTGFLTKIEMTEIVETPE